MRDRLLISLIAVAMLAIAPTLGLAAEQGTAAWTAPAETQAPLVPVADAVTADDGKTYAPNTKRMSYRERRFRGLTRWNIRRVAIDLFKAGKLDTSDRDLMQNQIMAQIVKEKPEAYPEPGKPGAPTEREWDEFFAFIEKLLTFLMDMFAAWGWMAI